METNEIRKSIGKHIIIQFNKEGHFLAGINVSIEECPNKDDFFIIYKGQGYFVDDGALYNGNPKACANKIELGNSIVISSNDIVRIL